MVVSAVASAAAGSTATTTGCRTVRGLPPVPRENRPFLAMGFTPPQRVPRSPRCPHRQRQQRRVERGVGWKQRMARRVDA